MIQLNNNRERKILQRHHTGVFFYIAEQIFVAFLLPILGDIV